MLSVKRNQFLSRLLGWFLDTGLTVAMQIVAKINTMKNVRISWLFYQDLFQLLIFTYQLITTYSKISFW